MESLRKVLEKVRERSVIGLKCLRHYGGLSLRYSPPSGSASRTRGSRSVPPRGDKDSKRKDRVGCWWWVDESVCGECLKCVEKGGCQNTGKCEGERCC